MDHFVIRLKMARRRGFIMQLVGAGLLGLTAIAWLAVSGIDGSIVMSVLGGSVSTIGGIAIFGRGTLQVAQATRRLRTAEQMRQLPVARVRQLP